jgi:leucyl aminopeptidase
MKGDMGGARRWRPHAYAGGAQGQGSTALGIVGLVRNMPTATPSGRATWSRPMSGQTIEVINTDAEVGSCSRDLLTYVQKHEEAGGDDRPRRP